MFTKEAKGVALRKSHSGLVIREADGNHSIT